MAKRSLIVMKKKKSRVTRNETFLVNFKYMGDEPVFTKPLDNLDYAKALNWYNTMCDLKECREFLDTYLKNSNRFVEAKRLNSVPDSWVNVSAAAVSRLLSKGYVIPETGKTFLESKIKMMLSHSTAPVEKKEDKTNVISIQDRIREKSQDIIGDIEEAIDSGEKFSLYDWLKGRSIPATYCTSIVNYYAPWLGELLEAYEGTCPQLKEAYAYMTKKQLKERIDFINSLLEDAEKYAGVAKKTRAPRKARPLSKEKILKNFRYQKEDNTFKIASVNPEKIIGAQELWTFNTKYKIVTVFRAIDRGGLQVKRTSITGFDPNTSFSKSAGRSAEAIVQKIQSSGKLVLRKLMDEMKTDKVLQERINENTVIMRVV